MMSCAPELRRAEVFIDVVHTHNVRSPILLGLTMAFLLASALVSFANFFSPKPGSACSIDFISYPNVSNGIQVAQIWQAFSVTSDCPSHPDAVLEAVAMYTASVQLVSQFHVNESVHEADVGVVECPVNVGKYLGSLSDALCNLTVFGNVPVEEQPNLFVFREFGLGQGIAGNLALVVVLVDPSAPSVVLQSLTVPFVLQRSVISLDVVYGEKLLGTNGSIELGENYTIYALVMLTPDAEAVVLDTDGVQRVVASVGPVPWPPSLGTPLFVPADRPFSELADVSYNTTHWSRVGQKLNFTVVFSVVHAFAHQVSLAVNVGSVFTMLTTLDFSHQQLGMGPLNVSTRFNKSSTLQFFEGDDLLMQLVTRCDSRCNITALTGVVTKACPHVTRTSVLNSSDPTVSALTFNVPWTCVSCMLRLERDNQIIAFVVEETQPISNFAFVADTQKAYAVSYLRYTPLWRAHPAGPRKFLLQNTSRGSKDKNSTVHKVDFSKLAFSSSGAAGYYTVIIGSAAQDNGYAQCNFTVLVLSAVREMRPSNVKHVYTSPQSINTAPAYVTPYIRNNRGWPIMGKSVTLACKDNMVAASFSQTDAYGVSAMRRLYAAANASCDVTVDDVVVDTIVITVQNVSLNHSDVYVIYFANFTSSLYTGGASNNLNEVRVSWAGEPSQQTSDQPAQMNCMIGGQSISDVPTTFNLTSGVAEHHWELLVAEAICMVNHDWVTKSYFYYTAAISDIKPQDNIPDSSSVAIAFRIPLAVTDNNLTSKLPSFVEATASPYSAVLGPQRLLLLQSVGLALPTSTTCFVAVAAENSSTLFDGAASAPLSTSLPDSRSMSLGSLNCTVDRRIASFAILVFPGASSTVARRLTINVTPLTFDMNVTNSTSEAPQDSRIIKLLLSSTGMSSQMQFAVFAANSNKLLPNAQCWNTPFGAQVNCIMSVALSGLYFFGAPIVEQNSSVTLMGFNFLEGGPANISEIAIVPGDTSSTFTDFLTINLPMIPSTSGSLRPDWNDSIPILTEFGESNPIPLVFLVNPMELEDVGHNFFTVCSFILYIQCTTQQGDSVPCGFLNSMEDAKDAGMAQGSTTSEVPSLFNLNICTRRLKYYYNRAMVNMYLSSSLPQGKYNVSIYAAGMEPIHFAVTRDRPTSCSIEVVDSNTPTYLYFRQSTYLPLSVSCGVARAPEGMVLQATMRVVPPVGCVGYGCGYLSAATVFATVNELGYAYFYLLAGALAVSGQVFVTVSTNVDVATATSIAQSSATGVADFAHMLPPYRSAIGQQFAAATQLLTEGSLNSFQFVAKVVQPLQACHVELNVSLEEFTALLEIQVLVDDQSTAAPTNESSLEYPLVLVLHSADSSPQGESNTFSGFVSLISNASLFALFTGQRIHTHVSCPGPGAYFVRAFVNGLPCDSFTWQIVEEDEDPRELSEHAAGIFLLALICVLLSNTPHPSKWLALTFDLASLGVLSYFVWKNLTTLPEAAAATIAFVHVNTLIVCGLSVVLVLLSFVTAVPRHIHNFSSVEEVPLNRHAVRKFRHCYWLVHARIQRWRMVHLPPRESTTGGAHDPHSSANHSLDPPKDLVKDVDLPSNPKPAINHHVKKSADKEFTIPWEVVQDLIDQERLQHYTGWWATFRSRLALRLEHASEEAPSADAQHHTSRWERVRKRVLVNLAESITGEAPMYNVSSFRTKMCPPLPWCLEPHVPLRFLIVLGFTIPLVVILTIGLWRVYLWVETTLRSIALYGSGEFATADTMMEALHGGIELSIASVGNENVASLRELYPIARAINIAGIVTFFQAAAQDLIDYLTTIKILSCAVACSCTLITLACLYRRIRRDSKHARQGAFRSHGNLVEAELEEADEYPGLQTVSLVVTFVSSAAFSGLMMAAVIVLLKQGFFRAELTLSIVEFIGAIGISEVVVAQLLQLCCRTGLEIQSPVMYGLLSVVFAVLSVFSGLVVAAIRLLKYFAVGGVWFAYFGRPMLPNTFLLRDPGYNAFMSLILVDHSANNSVKHVFCALLLLELEDRRRIRDHASTPLVLVGAEHSVHVQSLMRTILAARLGLISSTPPGCPLTSRQSSGGTEEPTSGARGKAWALLFPPSLHVPNCEVHPPPQCNAAAGGAKRRGWLHVTDLSTEHSNHAAAVSSPPPIRCVCLAQRMWLWYLLTICPTLRQYRKRRMGKLVLKPIEPHASPATDPHLAGDMYIDAALGFHTPQGSKRSVASFRKRSLHRFIDELECPLNQNEMDSAH